MLKTTETLPYWFLSAAEGASRADLQHEGHPMASQAVTFYNIFQLHKHFSTERSPAATTSSSSATFSTRVLFTGNASTDQTLFHGPGLGF